MTPYQKLLKVLPKLEHLWVWGCVVYVHEPDEHQTKLDSKNKQYIMVNYFDEFEVVKCYHPPGCKIMINKDVRFDEQNFWHSPIDSSSKLFVSLEKISNRFVIIEIIDPPTTITWHCLSNLTMEHVKPQEVTTIQQPLQVHHKCINLYIVDNLKQPSTLVDGE